MPEEQLIGEVFRYHDNDGMAFISLLSPLSVGQTIHIIDSEFDCIVPVEHMSVANQDVHQAYRGDYAGIYVGKPLQQHDKVFLCID